jgi:hypothetical protein
MIHLIDMKKIQLVIILLLISIPGFTQYKIGPKIQWEDENWIWGKIIMEQGVVGHMYKFVNVGDEPVKIAEVSPSCGCTVAEWSTQSILPGKSGFVKVKFDPKGKLGPNSKYVTVKTNSNPAVFTLTMKGEVVSNKWQRSKYKLQYGNLAVVTNKIEIGNIKENGNYKFEIPLANIGNKPIVIRKIFNASNIKITYQSNTIGIEEELILNCVYSPIKPTIFGENLHEIKILTNDDTLALKTFSLLSVVEEDFSNLTRKQLKKAPSLSFDKTEEQFGTVSDEDTKMAIFKLTNKGKSDLIIHKLVNQCECLEVESDKMNVKKGDFATITVKYSPRKYIGVDERFINIISNDPKNSNFTLTIKSYVLPAE